MKVKEIIEILEVEPEKLLNQLDNVGIEADLDTEIPNDIIKKLSKLYKKDIKPIKAKKSTETKTQTTKTTKDENPVEGKKEAKNEEIKVVPEEVVEENPVLVEKTPEPQPIIEEEVKEEENIEKVVEPEEIELSRVYDDKYIDFEEEKPQHTRIKNVKKNKSKSTGNRKANGATKKASRKCKSIFAIQGPIKRFRN